MENYEEKYKQALEKAKEFFNSPRTCFDINQLAKIFPELKESEDERIRKGLIKGLSAMRDIHKHQTFSDDAINIDDAIAWLEKQGEKTNPYSGISFEYNGHIWGMCAREGGVDILCDSQLIKHLEKKDEKPAEWSEEDELYLRKAIECAFGNGYLSVSNWLKSIKDRVQPQPKQEWNEEDEEVLNNIITAFKRIGENCEHYFSPDTAKVFEKTLKSLKDKVQPQPKQEWSEYDKVQLSEAIQMIEANGTWIRSEDAVKKVSNWLKSLKPNRWKPSDEQMEALNDVRHLNPGLVSLYWKLKKS